MLATDTMSPTQQIEAQVQAYVGEFLSSRAKLNTLAKSRDIDVSASAKSLLVRQLKLEGELQGHLKTLDNIKAGAYSIGSVTKLGFFANDMIAHLRDVKALVARAAPGATTSASFVDTISPTRFFMGVALVGLGLKFWESSARVRAARR